MNENFEKELSSIKELVEENNNILKSLNARARWATVWMVGKWVIYILIITGLYFIVQPYVDMFVGTYQNIKDSAGVIGDLKNKVPSIPSDLNISDLLKTFKQ